MKNYYIESAQHLEDVLRDRKANSGKIQRMIDEYVEAKYGIEHFSAISKSYFNISHSCTQAMLLRQIASVSVEDISCYVVSRILNLPIIGATLLSDNFTCNSLDKMSRIKIPWISWSKKGNMVKHNDYIAKESTQVLEGKPLVAIETRSKDMFLQAYHNELRNEVFEGNFPQVDCSNLLQKYVDLSKVKPNYMDQVGKKNGNQIKPPAQWYYPLYYLWFLDGSSILFETYENSLGNKNSNVQNLFYKTMDDIWSYLGISPVVVKILPAFDEIFYCNKHIDKSGLEKIIQSFCRRDVSAIQFPEFFSEVANKVISYK